MAYIAEAIGAVFIAVALVLGAARMLECKSAPRRSERREEE